MKDPQVSVLMPAYNVEAYIAQAIESILDQTFSDFEFIVVDDGSADRTPEVVRRYVEIDQRVLFFRSDTNLGVARARNLAMSKARGAYIAVMDADDWAFPYRLQRQVAFMDEHPDVVVSGGTIQVCDTALRPLNLRRYQGTDMEIRRRLFRYSPFAHPTVMYRRAIAHIAGDYNPALVEADDYDYYFRLGMHGRFANLPDLLLRLRTRRDSVSQANTRRMERLTIYIRFKAAAEYGYAISSADIAYSVLQYFSSFVIPPRTKFWLFNFLRGPSRDTT